LRALHLELFSLPFILMIFYKIINSMEKFSSQKIHEPFAKYSPKIFNTQEMLLIDPPGGSPDYTPPKILFRDG